jgi:hypothetical protein
VEAGVEEVHHRLGGAVDVGLAVEGGRARVHGLRVDVTGDLRGVGGRGGERGVGRGGDLPVDLLAQPLQLRLGGQALGLEELGERGEGIAAGVRLALRGGSVLGLVVGEGMRIGPDDLRVNEGRALPGATPGRGLAQDPEAGHGVTPVHLADQEVGERAEELGDAPARGLDLDGNGDGVAVVLNEVQDRQAQVGGGVETLPELALGGGAVPGRAQDDLVAGEGRGRGVRDEPGPEVKAALGAPRGLNKLGPGRRRRGDHVEPGVPPVRGHLPPARVGIVPRAHGGEKHLERGHPQLEEERPVAVVGVEPVVSGAEDHPGRDLDRLVAGAADLEEGAVLPLELDLLVVDAPREVHRAIDREQGLAVETEPTIDRR